MSIAKEEFAEGFSCFCPAGSRLLILGSFPSVKSRQEGFYYGNRQNRFWRVLAEYFCEPLPQTVAQKQHLLTRRGIALWDVVVRCQITGSSDASIRGEEIADIAALLQSTGISHILCNGTKAYELFAAHFPQYVPLARKMPSTSPANPRFSKEVWFAALKEYIPC